jgi:hypothetical protein
MARKGWTFCIAKEGSEDYRRLEHVGAEASVLGDYITLRENSLKIAVLEEFLHGTQNKIASFKEVPDGIAEIKVKEFMIRHSRLLGLDGNDLKALDWLKQDAIERAAKNELIWRGKE